MITQQEWAKAKRLLDANLSVPQISLRTGISAPTIYKFRETGGPKTKKFHQEIHKQLKVYKDFIDLRIRHGVYNATKLLSELEEKGFTGKYYLVNNYLNSRIKNRHSRANKYHFRKRSNESQYKPAIRYETGPAEQAQVDWTYIKQTKINGKTEKIYCFMYILCYSRMKYTELTVRQNLPTLIQCHINAFEKLGIPKEIVYDNMKTVVTKRIRLANGISSIQLNLIFEDFAKYYAFKIAPTPPHHPRSKGKVERSIRFFKENFLLGLRIGKGLKAIEELNQKIKGWLDNYGNIKPNETTKERPIDRWLKEKPLLYFPINLPPYQVIVPQSRFSDKDGTVDCDSCVYPIPPEYARKKIDINKTNQNGLPIVEFYYKGELIAKFYLSNERYKWIKHKDAIFFKSSPKKSTRRKIPSKITNNNKFPSIPSRSMSFYNQIIPEGLISKIK